MSFNCMILKTALLCVFLLLEKDNMKIIYEEESSRNGNVECFLNTEEDKVSLPKTLNRERQRLTKKYVRYRQSIRISPY